METKLRTMKSELKELEKTAIGIKLDVIKNALEYDEEQIKNFFTDLASHGCQSGMISHLIYYVDSNNYYDEHEEEIEDLLQEQKESLGMDSRPEFIASLNGSAENIKQEKNLLSWFAFEETARSLFEELGGEV